MILFWNLVLFESPGRSILHKQTAISWGTWWCWFSVNKLKEIKTKIMQWAPPMFFFFFKRTPVYVDSKATCALVSAHASKQKQVRLVRLMSHYYYSSHYPNIKQVISGKTLRKKKPNVSSPCYKHQNLALFAGIFSSWDLFFGIHEMLPYPQNESHSNIETVLSLT